MTSSSEPRPVSAAGQIYAGLAVGVLAVVIGWITAHGPAALRRPLLTPLVIGALCGLLTRTLLTGPAPRARRVLPLGAVLLALGTLHVGLFRQLERAAAARAVSHPGDLLGLQLQEQTAGDDPAAEPQSRKLRLGLRPQWRDYLTERSAVWLGEAPWPVPAIVLGVEALLAGAVGMWLARHSDSTRPESRAATPGP